MNKQQIFAVAGSISGWTGLILQYIATSREFDITFTQFMSYFTILTNLMVAVYFTALLFPQSSFSKKINTPANATALTIYILVVGLVYQTVLRQLFHPQGLFFLSDNIVHGITPILTLGYWRTCVYGHHLMWRNIWSWIIYPLAFLFYSLIRGAIVHWYPYPFLDVDTIGYPAVWTNSAGISAVFVGLSALFITLSNRKHKVQS